MGANVQELIREDGKIQGVVYQIPEGRREVRANLIAGADGRASRIRQLAGLPPIKTSPPMDIPWFRLPQFPKDKEYANLSVRMGRGFYLAFLNRMEYWQISYVIPKGAYQKFKKNGLDMFKKSITDVVPEFQDRIDFLNSWEQVSFLSVETNRLPRWHLPGLLLIGDAAHAMSSAGGVGINCAIMDAVAASNILSNPLKAGNLTEKHLAKVQKKRMWPTRITQILQSLAQRSLIARALNPNKPFKLPLTFRIPFLRNLAARLTAF